MGRVIVQRLKEKKEQLRKELGFESLEEFEEWLINWLEDFVRGIKESREESKPLYEKELRFKLRDGFIAIHSCRMQEDMVIRFAETVRELNAKLGEDVVSLEFKLEDGGHLTIDFWGDSRNALAKLFS